MYQFDSTSLIKIPGGEFRMGQEDGRDEERPVHCVWVEPFRLSLYQVTNAEYDAFLHATGRDLPPFRTDPKFGCPEQPVVGVSWFDAGAYCAWLSGVCGLECRLPTEAEWERAARAVGSSRVRFGDKLAVSKRPSTCRGYTLWTIAPWRGRLPSRPDATRKP